MTFTIHSPSHSVRDDIKTAFPFIGILNDFHQSFDIVFVDSTLRPRVGPQIVEWLMHHNIQWSIPIKEF